MTQLKLAHVGVDWTVVGQLYIPCVPHRQTATTGPRNCADVPKYVSKRIDSPCPVIMNDVANRHICGGIIHKKDGWKINHQPGISLTCTGTDRTKTMVARVLDGKSELAQQVASRASAEIGGYEAGVGQWRSLLTSPWAASPSRRPLGSTSRRAFAGATSARTAERDFEEWNGDQAREMWR